MASGYSRLPDESIIPAGGSEQRSYGTVDATVGFAPGPKSGTEFFQVCICVIISTSTIVA